MKFNVYCNVSSFMEWKIETICESGFDEMFLVILE